MYYDANNLYGMAMIQPLPLDNYKNEPDVDQYTVDKIMSLDDEGDTGYFFVVDLEYPKELHDAHNDYPLAPQKKVVTKEMLSCKTRSLMNKANQNTTETNLLIHLQVTRQIAILPETNLLIHLQAIKYLSLYVTLLINKIMVFIIEH